MDFICTTSLFVHKRCVKLRLGLSFLFGRWGGGLGNKRLHRFKQRSTEIVPSLFMYLKPLAWEAEKWHLLSTNALVPQSSLCFWRIVSRQFTPADLSLRYWQIYYDKKWPRVDGFEWSLFFVCLFCFIFYMQRASRGGGVEPRSLTMQASSHPWVPPLILPQGWSLSCEPIEECWFHFTDVWQWNLN